jgi:UDP-2-acetamido-3-amino-2,3-dideoxy-glucuronate N-acetyltransferase
LFHQPATVRFVTGKSSDHSAGSKSLVDSLIRESSIIGERVMLEKDVVIGVAVVCSAGPEGEQVLRAGVNVGAGSVIAGSLTVGVGARIEPGSVVTEDVPPYAIVAGNPARVVGYSAPSGPDRVARMPREVAPPVEPGRIELVGGASLIRFPEVLDLRGRLTFGQVGTDLPFTVQRMFCVYGVPSSSLRGEHAHRTCEQLLICVSGSLRVSMTDGRERDDVVLDSPSVGLHLPTLVWSTQYEYSSDAVLMVLCSETYDPASYIRNYDDFIGLVS